MLYFHAVRMMLGVEWNPVLNQTSRNSIEEHAPDVLTYAFKHNYLAMLDEAAPLTIAKPKELISIASNTAPGLLPVWVRDSPHDDTYTCQINLFFR